MEMQKPFVPAGPFKSTDPFDSTTLKLVIDQLEPFLVGDELYRTVVVPAERGTDRITMSLGDLLTRLHMPMRFVTG